MGFSGIAITAILFFQVSHSLDFSVSEIQKGAVAAFLYHLLVVSN